MSTMDGFPSGELPRPSSPKAGVFLGPELREKRSGRFANALRSRPVVAIAGAALTAAVIYGVADKKVHDHWNNKVAGYKNSTETLLAGWQAGGAPIANHNILLRAGVKLRTTPDLIGSGPSYLLPRAQGNVASTIGSGQVLAVHNAAELTENGSTWFVFQKNDGTSDKSPTALTSGQIAGETYFVDFSQLKGQTVDGQPLAEVLPNAGSDNCTVSLTHGSLAANGQFHSPDGSPAAWAHGESVSDYDVNARLFGIGNCAVNAAH